MSSSNQPYEQKIIFENLTFAQRYSHAASRPRPLPAWCNRTRTGAEIGSQYVVTCDSRCHFGTIRIVLCVLYRRSNYDLHPVLFAFRLLLRVVGWPLHTALSYSLVL